MVLRQKKAGIRIEIQPQTKEFKLHSCLRVRLKMEQEISTASAVLVKKQLSRKSKLWIYRLIYVPTLTHGRKLRVETEITRSPIRAADMSFLCRMSGFCLTEIG